MKKKFTILITAAFMLLTMIVQPGRAVGQTRTTVDDVLIASSFAATSTQYTDFSGVTFSSDAVYAGNSGKTSSGGIQLRSKNSNSGIVSTASGGTIHAVSVVVESGSNTLDIYGKNTAYSAASDLYNSSTQGTKIGSISATGTVDLTTYVDQYEYIGLRSNNGALYLTSITITWTTSGGGGSDPVITLSESGTINIGNYAVESEISSTFTVSQSNLSAGITLAATNGTLTPSSIDQGEDPTEVTWSYTPSAAGQFTSTITATSGETSAEFTYMGYGKTVHNVNIAEMTNGTVESDKATAIEGEYVTLTITPADGYALGTLTITGATSGAPVEFNTSTKKFQMPDENVSINGTFEASSSTTIEDVLTYSVVGVTGTSYSSWSGITSNSYAVYAGQSAGGSSTSGNCIQLRSNNNNSGIVTTTSGGTAKKVVVTWNSVTDVGRTLNIYGKSAAYSAAADLYNSNNQGTLLGTIVKNTSTELTIDGDYEFIGMRSNSGAMYLDEIRITWSTEAAAVAKPTFSPEAGTYPSTQNLNVTISCETEGSTIYYTTDGTDPTNTSTQYTAAIPVTETTTIKAIAYVGSVASAVASATYTIVDPYTTIPAIFAKATEVGSTQTDIYVTFSDWTVVGKSTMNAYVTDGQYGLNVYGSNSGFAIGDKLSGTVACKVQLYNGGAELVNLTAQTTGLTVTHDNTFEAYEISLENLTGQGIYFGSYVDLGNLTYSDSKFTDGEHTIIPYNTFYLNPNPVSSLTENKVYHVKGVYIRYSSTEERIAPVYASDFTEYAGPSLTIDPEEADEFSYTGAGPSDSQFFEVSGANLTSTIVTATITTGADYFEVSDDDEEFTNEISIDIDDLDVFSIRMKADLPIGSYQGSITLNNEGAEPLVMNLTGSVTGATPHDITSVATHGNITFAPESPVLEGAVVTMTPVADEGYEFEEDSWAFYDEDMNYVSITVTEGNKITMPNYNLVVDATFNPKATYGITCVADPVAGGELISDLDEAYEGQMVTLTYTAQEGFTLSSIVITKTSDGSATGITPTASGDDYTFTMPGYAVTATATFYSDTFEGTFVQFTGDAMEEGDYILVYNNGAMNNDNTTISERLGKTDVTPSGNIISNPSRNIVWHIAPIGTEGKWTIYNAVVNQYVNASSSGNTKITLVDNASWSNGAKWNITIDGENNTYDFNNLSSTRALRYYESSDVFGHYATSNGGPLTLYKYTVLTPRTITFNGNGGKVPSTNQEEYTQIVYDGIATNLELNQFTKANSAFAGWSTTQNGEVEYADGASITVSSDITLYAQWSTAYTAMVDDAIVGGTVLINGDDSVEVAAGTVMTLTYNATPGYTFSAWNVYNADDQTITIDVENNQFNMPEYDVIVSASFDEVTTYSLVTNVNQIVSGKHYIIATGSINNKYYAIGGQNSSGYRNPVEVTVDNNYIAHTDGLYEFVLNVDNESGWTIYDKVTPGYFVFGNKSLTTNANNGTAFNISINDENDPKATISKNGYSIQYNSSSPRFACYSSSQKDVYLYIKLNDNDLEYYGSEITYTENTIPTGETITVGTGSVMTINNGSFTNTDPEKLIIEDGGQLITDSPNVAATVKKNIVGHNPSKDGVTGYYLISSPINNMDPNAAGMITGSYDLYWFDQAKEDEEWRNYKKATFNLASGQGYLYANEENEALAFAGDIYAGDGVVTLHSQGGGTFEGWNLVGNPFTQNAYINRSHYIMNEEGSQIVLNENAKAPIMPMQGIFVFTDTDGETLTFSKTAPDGANGDNGGLTLNVSQTVNTRGESSNNLVDRAIVRFGVNDMLPKFQLNENSSKVYFTEGNQDYAVVSAEAQGEMPVYFKAAENGTYTISFSMDNVEFGYLHLIDNKTGNDVDLRQTPSYTFEASTIDYASRFRLVFRAIGNENDSENNDFGFFDANGNFLILGIEGTATLQVMDVMGRVISNETFSGDYSKAINASAGVYMLRLIQGSNVRTQKVVVK